MQKKYVVRLTEEARIAAHRTFQPAFTQPNPNFSPNSGFDEANKKATTRVSGCYISTKMVEDNGIEPMTSCMPCTRSPS
ncbi:MAG: hypothetical protein DRP64_14505, partial [Verrucomicrobia bacterium]